MSSEHNLNTVGSSSNGGCSRPWFFETQKAVRIGLLRRTQDVDPCDTMLKKMMLAEYQFYSSKRVFWKLEGEVSMQKF